MIIPRFCELPPEFRHAPLNVKVWQKRSLLEAGNVSRLFPKAGGISRVLSDVDAEFSISGSIYPDTKTIESVSGFELSLVACFPYFSAAGRVPMALALGLNKYVREMNDDTSAVLVVDPRNATHQFAIAGNADKKIVLCTFPELLVAARDTGESASQTQWLTGDGPFVPDQLTGRIGLLFIDDFALRDSGHSYFYPGRFLEALAPLLSDNGIIVIASPQSARVRDYAMTVLGNFLPEIEVTYSGRFGVSERQSVEYQVLRRVPSQGRVGRMHRLQSSGDAFFAQRWMVTHQWDFSIPVVPVDELLAPGTPPHAVASAVLQPARRIDVTTNQNVDAFPGAWREYFATSYDTPEIRVTRLSPGIVFGRNPWLTASLDGRIIVGNLVLGALAPLLKREIGNESSNRDRRRASQPYWTDVLFSRDKLPDVIPIVNGEVETPVFWIYSKWMDHISHYVFEIAPQIEIWKTHFRDRGVKIATVLSREYQREIIDYLGVPKEDVINMFTMGGWQFKELYFTNAFEDAVVEFLPEMAAFPLKPPVKVSEPLKVYASRLDTSRRQMTNEAALIERFRSEGYYIFIGTEHNLEKKIEVFRHADVVVGPYGTNLMGVVFCPEGTAFLEILSEAAYDPYFMRIANLRGLTYDNVRASVAEGGDLSEIESPICVDVEEVFRKLDSLLKRRERTKKLAL